MAYNEARKQSTMKYIKENTDEIKLRFKSGAKEELRNHLKKHVDKYPLVRGEVSMRHWIKIAIAEKIARDNGDAEYQGEFFK